MQILLFLLPRNTSHLPRNNINSTISYTINGNKKMRGAQILSERKHTIPYSSFKVKNAQ